MRAIPVCSSSAAISYKMETRRKSHGSDSGSADTTLVSDHIHRRSERHEVELIKLKLMQEFKNFDQYGEMLQKMYADATAVAESIKAAADADREDAFIQLDAARDARKAAEENGEKIAIEYFARKRKFLVDSTREEQLRHLVLKNLHQGKQAADVQEWFDLNDEQLQKYQQIMLREVAISGTQQLDYTQDGRGGKVIYTEGSVKLEFDWEFAGGRGVAIIFVPESKYWEAQTGLSLKERMRVLDFVGRQAVIDKAPECVYEITDGFVEIVYR